MLTDVGFLKAYLSKNLVPSTSTHYLGSMLESFLVPWNLHALMVYFLTNDHGNASMYLD